MKFVNLTPHTLVIEGVGTLPASGIVARVATIRTQLGAVAGVRVVAQNLGRVEGLPDAKADTAYVVSALVLDAIKRQSLSRGDVYAPDTGPDAVRENGQIVAVRGLVV